MNYTDNPLKIKTEKKDENDQLVKDENGNTIFEEKIMYYAKAKHSGVVDIKRIANDISKYCTLTTPDIIAVLQSFLDKFPEYLMDSQKVNLQPFGSYKLALNSESKETEEEVTAKTIKGVRVLFTPSVELKKALTSVKFKKK